VVVAACKLSGRDEETALKALAEMPEGVLETHTAAHLQNGEESTWWNAEGTAPDQHALWNAEGTAPDQLALYNAESGLNYSAAQHPEDTTTRMSADRQPTSENRLISKIGTPQQTPMVDMLAGPR
jgi:hypothetical protein